MSGHNETLARCPLCGSKAHMCEMESGYGTEYSVCCNNGKCRLSEHAKYGYACKTEAEAITAWNQRHVETCENMEKRNASLWFVCSKCGAQAANGTYSEEWTRQDHTDEEYAEYDGEAFKYCPNCGAKVVS